MFLRILQERIPKEENCTSLVLEMTPNHVINGDPPQDFNAKGESTRTTRFHFKTKEFILTRFSTLAILPH